MSELCREVCPTYLACQSALDVAAAEKQSLLKERSLIEEAARYRQSAETEGAFAILSGELTADEHEELQRELEQNPELLTINYAERLARIEHDIKENDSRADHATAAAIELSQGIDICEGPTLGVVRNVMFNLRNREIKSDKESPDQLDLAMRSRDISYKNELLNHGRCTNPSAKQVLKTIPKFS